MPHPQRMKDSVVAENEPNEPNEPNGQKPAESNAPNHTNIKGISGFIVVPFFIWMALIALI